MTTTTGTVPAPKDGSGLAARTDRPELAPVAEYTPLPSPRAFRSEYPASGSAAETVRAGREAVRRIVRREDPRFLVVVGPCSLHDPEAALEYAERLATLHRLYADRLYIVMRAYFEKPRTSVGWKGLINDPHLDGSFDMEAGLTCAAAC